MFATIPADIPCDSCGYNLRSLAPDAVCPECRAPVTQSVVDRLGERGRELPIARSERRWATLVIVGLASMLVLYPQILWVELYMDFNGVAFGNAPKLNVIGPKVWAKSLVQRSIGNGVESLGGSGTWLPLMNVTAVWLLTARRGLSETLTSRTNLLRLLTRWGSAALVGGYFGFMLNVEGTYYTDIGLSKYALVGVACVELPATALLLAYLSAVAGALGRHGLSRRFLIALAGCFTAQLTAVGLALVSGELAPMRHTLGVQVTAAVFQAANLVIGLFIAGLMAELIFCLAGRVVSRRWRAWTA